MRPGASGSRLRTGALAVSALLLGAFLVARWLAPGPPAPAPEAPAAASPAAPEPEAAAPLAGAATEPARAARPVAPGLPGAAAIESLWGPGEPTRESLRARLGPLTTELFGGRPLASGRLESLIDAALRLHAANRELGELAQTPENAARIAELGERARRAEEEWRAILEAPPAEVESAR
jgi:hypothetical protein